MLFFYVRHGDPIYSPDSLTPLGERQAEAVAKRLALFGIDKIYSSTSKRALDTSRPTCELVKKEAIQLDFCNESHAWRELTVEREDGGGKTWLFHNAKSKLLFCSDEIKVLGERWYEHPEFEKYNFKAGIERIAENTDEFLLSLGYKHINRSGMYEPVNHTDERVALFAHQGFGIAFLSHVLGIPYPQFSTHFDMTHSGITVIEFKPHGGYVIPKVLTLSSDSHLYREGLPLKYNHEVSF